MTQLVSRQAGTQLAARPAPERPLSEIMEKANAIARAGEVIPKAFQGNPGAVMLVLDWAAKNGIDDLTAIQNIVPIQGKLSYSAEMWEYLAQRKGRGVRIDGDVTDTCTAVVYDLETGAEYGRWTSTMSDANTRNAVWKQFPRQMLRANAIRNAVKFHGEVGLLGAADRDEWHEAPDPVDVIAEQPQPQVEVDPQPDVEPDDDIVEAEVVEVRDYRAELSAAGIKQAEALRAAQMLAPDAHITSVSKFEGHDGLFDRVLAGEGIE